MGDESDEIEAVVRARLRSLRTTLGLSLDELAARTNLSPSTISRIETGKRAISLDVLLPLASALQVDLDALLDRARRRRRGHPPGAEQRGRAHHLDAEPTDRQHDRGQDADRADRPSRSEQRVHPGHDWFFVIEGRVRLLLGDREIVVETGEAAEFATMTPHAIAAHRRPRRAHHDLRPRRPARPRPPRIR